LKFKANVWGYTGNAIDVMDKIRQQFDAQGLLSPDRMFSYSALRSSPNQ
jgi:glycolate oxidase FAD binding subunit